MTTVASGLSLGRMLLSAMPDVPDPRILAAAEALGASVDELEARWKAKEQAPSAEDTRPYDHRLDRAWAAIEASLGRYTVFEPADPDRERAAEIHRHLFPTGLSFIKLPYLEQHAQSARRIDLIEEEGLREDLDRLVGMRFLDELFAAHEAYGVALQITAASDTATPASLVPALRALHRAISSHALQLLAFADGDPERTAVVRRALEPIDAVRRANARRAQARGLAVSEESMDPPEPETDDEPTRDDLAAVPLSA